MRQIKEQQIEPNLATLTEAVNRFHNGLNHGIVAQCEDGMRHTIHGVVELDGEILGGTYVGWLAVESASVFEE